MHKPLINKLLFIAGWTIATLFALNICLFLLYFFAPDWLAFAPEKREGDSIVAEIEIFKVRYQRLPSNDEYTLILKKLSLPENGESCPCYDRKNANSYSVWYQGRSLGQSFIYHSDTKEWMLDGG